jgi:hypothetical protein
MGSEITGSQWIGRGQRPVDDKELMVYIPTNPDSTEISTLLRVANKYIEDENVHIEAEETNVEEDNVEVLGSVQRRNITTQIDRDINANPSLKVYWDKVYEDLTTNVIGRTGEYSKFVSLEEAKRFVHSLNIKSNKEWDEYCISGNKPETIPANYRLVYNVITSEWLGTERISDWYKKFKTLDELKMLVNTLNIKSKTEWYEHWKNERMNWHLSLGIDAKKYRFHDHVKLAHYADAALDIEYEFPFGFKEVEGIHSRTDFDLSRHQEFSKKKMQYFDTEINQHYIPYVIETSIGLDRMFLLILSNSYEEETINKEDGTTDSRVVLHLPAKIAPNKLAILPLTKKDGLPEIAKALMDDCKKSFHCFYEEKDAIGKRYRRQDAIGTPFCVTIDHQTKEDGTVTVRHRDSMTQERIPMDKVKSMVLEAIS